MNIGDISVVVCTRDRPEALRTCLESISRSLLLPREVVVIDQSSNDGAKLVAAECISNSDLHIRYYQHNGIGHTTARNIGIRMSLGYIIAFTDDDCVVDKSWLQAICTAFEKSCANCICGQTIAASHHERPKSARLSTFRPLRPRTVRGLCNPLMVGRGNNMAFRRSDLLKIGGFNEKIGVGTSVYAGDDTDIFYRLILAKGTIAVTPEVIIHHAQPDNWQMVIRKKRGYAISFSAIFAGKAMHGDIYAGMLLLGKFMYEAVFLLLGGVLSMRRHVAEIGWHSLMGSLSGLKFAFNRDFTSEIGRLAITARKANLEMPATSGMPNLTSRPSEIQDRP